METPIKILLATSPSHLIVKWKDKIMVWNPPEPPSQAKYVRDEETFLAAACAKWGFRRVIGAPLIESFEQKPSLRLVQKDDGELVLVWEEQQ